MSSTASLQFALIDAFHLGRGFTGNPAAVVVLPPRAAQSGGNLHISFPAELVDSAAADAAQRTTALCQMIAAEMNQSETAFVQRQPSTSDASSVPCFNIRWFTPTSEVPLCVHASLAAAHCLSAVMRIFDQEKQQEQGQSKQLDLRTTNNGRTLRVDVDTASASYTLRVPNNKALRVDARSDPYSAEVLRAVQRTCGAPRVLNVFYNKPTKKYLVELDTPEAVADLRPDISALHRALAADKVASVTFTAQVKTAPQAQSQQPRRPWSALGGIVAVSRHFAPWVGIPEDAATGAAHAVLCPVYAERLGHGPDDEARYFQAMPGRGAFMTGRVRADHVLLTGRGHTIVAGALHLARADGAAAVAWAQSIGSKL